MNLLRIIISGFILLVSTTISAQQPQWVGLYPADFNPIFPKEGTWLIDLHKLPDVKSPKTGKIKIQFINGDGFYFSFLPSTNPSKTIGFETDLYESDWGYGPYYHQTVLSVKGEWVLLPRNPMKQNAWANLSKVLGDYDVKTIEKGMLYKFNDRSVFIIRINKNSITIRDEQDADMWCEAGTPPPLNKFTPETLSFSDLYDKDKHLKLKIKYTRGC